MLVYFLVEDWSKHIHVPVIILLTNLGHLSYTADIMGTDTWQYVLILIWFFFQKKKFYYFDNLIWKFLDSKVCPLCRQDLEDETILFQYGNIFWIVNKNIIIYCWEKNLGFFFQICFAYINNVKDSCSFGKFIKQPWLNCNNMSRSYWKYIVLEGFFLFGEGASVYMLHNSFSCLLPDVTA